MLLVFVTLSPFDGVDNDIIIIIIISNL